MTPRQAKRHIDRAVDQLRRGYAIGLKYNNLFKNTHVAELAHPGESLPAIVVIPATRAAMIAGHDFPEAQALALGAGEERLLAELLGDPSPQVDASRFRTVDRMEQAGLMLVKATGYLPVALMRETPFEAETEMVDVDTALSAIEYARPALSMSPAAQLPLKGAEDARVVTFREEGGMTHLAVIVGTPEKDSAPMVRLHSSCLTGDLLGSLRCDCGDQLALALEHLKKSGGVLLYLNQEGRGIGLANKLHAYRLQEKGFDTAEANHLLGFADDERDFTLASEMLKALGIARIRLLTNNPRKQEILSSSGIIVTERVPLEAAPGAHNSGYLETKMRKFGHFLGKKA